MVAVLEMPNKKDGQNFTEQVRQNSFASISLANGCCVDKVKAVRRRVRGLKDRENSHTNGTDITPPKSTDRTPP